MIPVAAINSMESTFRVGQVELHQGFACRESRTRSVGGSEPGTRLSAQFLDIVIGLTSDLIGADGNSPRVSREQAIQKALGQ